MSKDRAPPPPPEELDVLLRTRHWQAVRARLFMVASRKTESRAEAEEIADAVIVDCCDPEAAPWNPNAEPDIVRHALFVLRDKLSAERKKRNVRKDPRNVIAVGERAPRGPDPAQALEAAERNARNERIMEGARKRLREPLDHEALELWLDGVEKPAEQALRLGRPSEDIRRARERIKYALRAAIDEEEASR